MSDLRSTSIQLILDSQAPSGAYPAAVGYPVYRYSWFRDGSYIAYAMDLAGEHDSAARFHDWAATVINRRADTIQRIVHAQQQGLPLTDISPLHTRYTLDGEETSDDWPNFQLDGFGTWLWSVQAHLEATSGRLPSEWDSAASLTSEYLTALWNQPCYDCWEEFPEYVHTHTLAAIHGGLNAHQLISGRDHQQTLNSITELIDGDAVLDGYYTKYLGSPDIDASLISLATPYQVVEPDRPALTTTIQLIDTTLRANGGGPHRYTTDSFYGGGEWVVLAGWLGWHYAKTGDRERGIRLLEWMEAQADARGNLPEQIPHSLNVPAQYDRWTKRWGPIAQPLLWSHANYLILHHHLNSP
jgi:GH15 family glucan-1,4-alpha-glucosidase